MCMCQAYISENIEGNQTTYPPDTRGDALTIELQSRCTGKVTV